MKLKHFLIFTLYPSISYTKSLEAMASSATTSLSRLGAAVVGLGLLWSGILYIKGSMEGREKLTGVMVACVLIFGMAGIIGFVRKITG